MNSILIEYRLFDSPKSKYITLNKMELCGNSTVLEFIAAQHDYPTNSITVLDLIGQ
jgi:hypothetical protein